MRARLIAPLVALAASLFVTPALAQDFGQQGDVSFGADRLFGFYILDDPDATSISLGSNTSPFNAPYTTARLGVDFFVIDYLSLGGSIGFWNLDDDDDRVFLRDDDQTGFLFHFRVGYALHFSDSFGFWPRGGLTFWDVDYDDEFDLTAEGMFFFTPVDHFGFLFGPSMDIGLAGDGDEGFAFGIINAGIFGYL